MVRNRQIYNIWGLFAGSAPSYSGEMSDYNNEKFSSRSLTIFDNNLLQQIERVNSFNYQFDVEQTNISQLGTRSLVNRIVLNRPSIAFGFNYSLVDLRNEKAIGFVVNYPDITGNPILNQEICCIKSFTGALTDSRNLYLAISPDNLDLNERLSDQFTSIDGTSTSLDPKNLYTIGFGNSYLNSYSMSASVGSFPHCSVGYVCDNILINSSGSGANIPAVFPKSGNLVSGVLFTIPRAESNVNPSVVRPEDISLKIYNSNLTSETNDALLGIASSGMAIQSFDIKLNLPREELKSIGYVLPLDRRINFPVFADINISTIIGDNKSCNLADILNINANYGLLINLYNHSCDTNPNNKTIAIQYKIQNAKYTSTSYSYDIGNNLIGNFGFVAEIDVSQEKGMFISGTLNVPAPDFPYDFLLLESNKTGFLFTEDDNLIIIRDKTLV